MTSSALAAPNHRPPVEEVTIQSVEDTSNVGSTAEGEEEASPSTVKKAESMARRLNRASEVLLETLFHYLSQQPDEDDENKHCQHGLALPAAAIGWLSFQYEQIQQGRHSSSWRPTLVLSTSMRDRLSLLRFLLPRATHLRVTLEEWPPSTSKQRRTLQSNGLVDATTTNVPSQPKAFLQQVQQFQQNINVQLFSRLQVLWLDGIPSEWVHNLVSIRHSLQVLRVERGAIFNLETFLFGDCPHAIANRYDDSLDPLQPPSTHNKPIQEEDDLCYSQLTHLKLQHCSLGELSVRRKQEPLSRLPRLTSLSLAHNQFMRPRTALSGLKSLLQLSTLDLSYNQLVSMERAHCRLGHICTLLLRGNQLTHTRGLDRLVGLQVLDLQDNAIDDLAQLAGLARLPDLQRLHLRGNPLEARYGSARLRVEVLDLFRDQRLSMVGNPQSLTFRQFAFVLPILDHQPVTQRELLALRGRTFVPTRVMPSILLTVEPSPTDDELRRCRRRRQRRRAHIQTESIDQQEAVFQSKIDHLRTTQLDEQMTRTGVPVGFSFQDVIASLAKNEAKAKDEEVPTEEPQQGEESESDESETSAGDTLRQFPFIPAEVLEWDVAAAAEVHANYRNYVLPEVKLESKRAADQESSVNEEPEEQLNADISQQATLEEDDGTFESDKLTRNDSLANGDKNDVVTSVFHHDELLSPKKNGIVVSDTDEVNAFDPTPKRKAGRTSRADVVFGSNDERPSLPFFGDRPSVGDKSSTQQADESDAATSPPPLEGLSDFAVKFPEHVWQDDQSVPSSLGTFRSDTPRPSRYKLAEQNSVYDGPDYYRNCLVASDMELYFQTFVFSRKSPDSCTASVHPQDLLDEDNWQVVSWLYPRIQLWPVDRRHMEMSVSINPDFRTLVENRETFQRLWPQEMIACGTPSAKRLIPNRVPRLGFHGDVLWNSTGLSVTTEGRTALLCLSDKAIYILAHHDPVTAKQVEEGKKHFPLPISKKALFEDAKWPHAVARHSFHSLKGITIGFGFQRLTLRFEKDHSDDAFTYVLLTSSKTETVRILQELQTLAKEAVAIHQGFTSNIVEEDVAAIQIDNDDKQVLDALATAVAPDASVGVILHYQILQQRWKHGDRGYVRRVCVVTDAMLFLLDEDYAGDGSGEDDSSSLGLGTAERLGDVRYRVVDSAQLMQITNVQAADADPKAMTIILRPLSRLARIHRWRLVCKDAAGAEKLVEDVRKAMALSFQL